MLRGPRGGEGRRPGPRQFPGRYTVILVGGDADPVRRFVVSRASLRRGAWALALLVAGLLGGLAAAGTFAVSSGRERARVHAAKQENAALRAQLDAVREKVGHISATLDQVDAREAGLRTSISGLQVLDPRPPEGKPEAPSAPRSRPAGEPALGPSGALDPPPPDARSTLPAAVSEPLARLAAVAARQEAALGVAQAYFDDQRTLVASSPSAWPVRALVTSDFGTRLDPYTARWMSHRGLDVGAPVGQPVYAPSQGTVILVGTEHGYGKVVEIDHGHGVRTRFGHLSEIFVKRGQRVSQGDRVGAVGNTGRSTGPHLHYEVLVNGVAENPRKFMLE